GFEFCLKRHPALVFLSFLDLPLQGFDFFAARTAKREEFLDVFLDDLELPDLAKRRLAETEEENPFRAGYSVSGSPSNIAVGRTTRLAMMRRVALGRPR
ncbi:DUF444 family protein, partial [Rhizobium leguminosarum]|uniref:DUF444 family protein n=1 Tax=Rhizobium leguminosarum TaxID=384 RepID=UPI003F976F7C